MSELAIMFVKSKDTKTIRKIKFNDSKYIDIEQYSLKDIITRFLKEIYIYIFKKQTVIEENLYEQLKNTAETLYDEHNKQLKEQNLPLINYQECFDNEDEEIPNYIM